MICAACKKPLRATQSIALGLGPVCAKREALAPFLFPEDEVKPITVAVDFIFLRGGDGILQVLPGRSA